MSRIRIYNSSMALLGTVQDVVTAARTERLNSDNVLAFSVPLTSTVAPLIAAGNVAELDGDYFDIVYYTKGQDSNGDLVASAECEHVSYRLNQAAYDLEYFTQTGIPTAILTELLDGTGFTIGTVDFTTSVTYSAQEAMSRRMLLMEFVATLGGELDFDQFEVSVLTQRGSTTPIDLTATRDVEVISKVYNAREKDAQGNALVSYTCSMIRPVSVALGDVVTLDYAAVDIDVELRVVAITTNPYNRFEANFEIGNFIPGLADDAYRIETSTLTKGKTYYGARISPENGFESIRSDKMARTVMNADTFAMQKGDGSGSAWTDVLYFNATTGEYVFDGKLSAGLISALEAEFDVTISQTVIVNNLAAEKANIAELTVDELDTSDMVRNYVDSSLADVGYIRIYNQHIDFMVAQIPDPLDVDETPVLARKGEALYWLDDTYTGVSIDALDPEGNPREQVMRYVYDGPDGLGLSKLQLFFEDSGSFVPTMVWGAGNLAGRMKGYIYKDTEAMVVAYESSTGEMREIRLGEDGVFITPYDLEEIAFSTGGFSVKYSGQTYDWAWTKDGNGKITQLETEDRTIPVTWP
jgi:hypothetical protein